MRCAILIKLTAFSYENENTKKILSSYLRFFPFDLEKNKIAIKKSIATGFNERKIEVFETALMKNRLINQFLENMLANLDEEQKNKILAQAESRLDTNLDFFLRFDKNSWINDKKLVLTDSGKCFHIKISILAFPKKREAALNVVEGLLSK